MNTKHTPAPWNRDLEAIKDVMGRFRIQVYRKGLQCIAVISGNNKKEVEANAKLIALSPVMFEYLVKKSNEGCDEAKNILLTLDYKG